MEFNLAPFFVSRPTISRVFHGRCPSLRPVVQATSIRLCRRWAFFFYRRWCWFASLSAGGCVAGIFFGFCSCVLRRGRRTGRWERTDLFTRRLSKCTEAEGHQHQFERCLMFLTREYLYYRDLLFLHDQHIPALPWCQHPWVPRRQTLEAPSGFSGQWFAVVVAFSSRLRQDMKPCNM